MWIEASKRGGVAATGVAFAWLAVVTMVFVVIGVGGQEAEFENEEFDVKKTRCEVCKTAMKILSAEIDSTDPAKVVDVGSFRLQADGSTYQKKAAYRGSETQLHDLIDEDKICGGLKDYVPVTDKETGELSLLNMMEDLDRISKVKFNPNPDFNSKMNNLCAEMIGDYEDVLIDYFKKGEYKTALALGKAFCVGEAGLCDPSDTFEALISKDSSKKITRSGLNNQDGTKAKMDIGSVDFDGDSLDALDLDLGNGDDIKDEL